MTDKDYTLVTHRLSIEAARYVEEVQKLLSEIHNRRVTKREVYDLLICEGYKVVVQRLRRKKKIKEVDYMTKIVLGDLRGTEFE